VSPDTTRVLSRQKIGPKEYLYCAEVDGSAEPVQLHEVVPFAARFSPDGSHVVYGRSNGGGNYELWSARADGSAPPTLLFAPSSGAILASWPPSSGADTSVACTPDGTRVVYRRRLASVDTLWSIPIDGGVAVQLNEPLTSGGNVTFVTAGESGVETLYVADQVQDGLFELRRVPADASSGSILLSHVLLAGESFDLSASRQPVAFAASQRVIYQTLSSTQRRLFSAPLDGSAPAVELVTSAATPFSFAVSADGAELFYGLSATGARDLWRVPLDGSTAPLSIASVGVGPIGRIRVSPDGLRVVFSDAANQELALVGRDGAGLRSLGVGQALEGFEQFTPDSTRLLVYEPALGLQSYAADGSGTPLLVAALPGGRTCVGFQTTEDSTQVVFQANLEIFARWELFRTTTQTVTSPVRLLPHLPGGLKVASFLLGGHGSHAVADYWLGSDRHKHFTSTTLVGTPRTIVLSASYPEVVLGQVTHFDSRNGHTVFRAQGEVVDVAELYGTTCAGGVPIKLNSPLPVGHEVGLMQLSPDGRLAAYRTGNIELPHYDELFVVASDGSSPPVRLYGGAETVGGFQFSPDGTRIVWERLDSNGTTTLWSVSIDGSGLASLGVGQNVTITPDSSRVVGPLGGFPLASVSIFGGSITELGATSFGFPFLLTPDGQHVVYQDDDFPYLLHSVPTVGGPATPLHDEPVLGGGVESFLLTNERVVFLADLLVENRVLCWSAPLDGSAPPIVLNGGLTGGGDVVHMLVTRSGTVIYSADQEIDQDFDLYRVPSDGSVTAVKIDAVAPGPDDTMVLTPDERFVLVNNGSVLRSVAVRGGVGRTLSASPVGLFLVSQDSRRVAFQSSTKIFTIPTSGGPLTLLADTSSPSSSFSIDGPATLIRMESDGIPELYSAILYPGARESSPPSTR
jgi:Tol biopolymer transport system component